MWECINCKEEIEEKYRHCWNCGKSKTEVDQDYPEIKLINDEPLFEEKSGFENEISPKKEMPSKAEFLFERELGSGGKPPSKIKTILLLCLWFAAFIFVAGFTYLSYQKRNVFENRITEEVQNLSKQTNQFVFSKTALSEKGNVKAKVLPLNAKNNEIDGLYNYLPDDLRPANPDEVNTIMWLDCNSDKVWVYDDDSFGYREKCNAYLVDRNTSKIIEVQNFIGEMPPLTKKPGTPDAYGKVLRERYISYIKESQTETERTRDMVAADSPTHHFFSKSELIYAILLICFFGALGLGWLAYKLKFSYWDPG